MKKIKLLLPLMTVVASTSTLSSLLSSCNNGQKSYKQQAEQITEEAIKEFFDICKVPHFSYKLDKIRAYYKNELKIMVLHITVIAMVTFDLTFEMVTLLSDADGNMMKSKWDLSNNYDYTNSVLRWNLNGAGSGTKPSSDVWTTSALQMMQVGEPALFNNLKTVSKQVATTKSYTITSYDDKLFPLTYTEMAQSGSLFAKVEGSAYKYWTDHGTNNDRIKRDVKGQAFVYWFISPHINDTSDQVWCVSSVGGIGYHTPNYPHAVSFGFCI